MGAWRGSFLYPVVWGPGLQLTLRHTFPFFRKATPPAGHNSYPSAPGHLGAKSKTGKNEPKRGGKSASREKKCVKMHKTPCGSGDQEQSTTAKNSQPPPRGRGGEADVPPGAFGGRQGGDGTCPQGLDVGLLALPHGVHAVPELLPPGRSLGLRRGGGAGGAGWEKSCGCFEFLQLPAPKKSKKNLTIRGGQHRPRR